MKMLERLRALLPGQAKSQCDPNEGSWRGPFYGMGEQGHWFPFDVHGDGWFRNIGMPGRDRVGAVHACVAAYAQTAAAMEMSHQRALGNGGWEVVTTSALSRILRSPNSYQTGSDFRLNLVHDLLYHGNAYAVVYRNERYEVDSMHLVPSRGTQPYIDPDSKEVFYGLGENPLIGDLQVMVPARDVFHVRLHTPRHPLIGVSPIEYAALAMDINTAIASNQSAFFHNMSRPSGVLTTDAQFTKEQMLALRQAWEEQSKGVNAGKVPILSWGLKWDPMTITSEDAQLMEAYRMSIEDIARVFRVPLMLIGDMTKSTYNNAEALISVWLSTGLGFMLEHIEATFEKFFKLPHGERVEFDVEALMRTDFEARINGLTKAISGGLMSPNEARAREGLSSVEYGQEPRVQAQVVPLSQVNATPAPSAPSAPSAPASEEEPAPTEEQRMAAAYVARKMIERAMSA